MKEFIVILVVVTVVILGAINLIDTYLSTPVVQITYPGEECIKIKYAPDHFGCDNLPRKYIVEWVGERQ